MNLSESITLMGGGARARAFFGPFAPGDIVRKFVLHLTPAGAVAAATVAARWFVDRPPDTDAAFQGGREVYRGRLTYAATNCANGQQEVFVAEKVGSHAWLVVDAELTGVAGLCTISVDAVPGDGRPSFFYD